MIRRDSPVAIDRALNAATFLIALLVFLTVCTYIGPVFFAAFLLLFFCAAWGEWHRRYLPKILLTVASLTIIGLFFYRLHLADLAPQAVETLLLLLAVKLLERKGFRDFMQVYVISVFLLAGSALLGINLIFLSYVIILAFFFNASMVLVAYHKEDPGMVLSMAAIEKIVWRSSFIPVCAIPLGALIFVITPRTPFPLLDFLNQGSHSTTGFSDQVRLGRVSDIQEDESIVFRAAMKRIGEDDLYWRGIVLDHFDGATWKSRYKRIVMPGRRAVETSLAPVWQEIYVEPYGNTYLFALDHPSRVLLQSVKEFADGTFSSDQILTRKVRYRAMSIARRDLRDETADATAYVQLPENVSMSMLELARSLRSQKGPRETLSSIQSFLDGRRFTYSLTNLPVTQHPLEDFLFTHRSGNCEYFASAFSVLARINGIPARLIAGYRGGLYNNFSGYYLVSQKDAHVWVEAFIPGTGWLRYDPTPASARYGSLDAGFLSRVRLYLDGINYFWVAFVVNYDVQKQFMLFANTRSVLAAGTGRIGTLPEGKYLLFFVCAVALLFGGLATGRLLRKSPARRLSENFLRGLEKRGYPRKESQGLEELVSTIADDLLRDRARQIAEGFETTYYRDRPFSRKEIKRLKRLIKELPYS